MQHLSPERIASLVDEPATTADMTHFQLCSRCRADFVAVRRIVASAAEEREQPIVPLNSWQQLAGALRAEGLMGPVAPVVAHSVVTEGHVRSIDSAASVGRDSAYAPAREPVRAHQITRRSSTAPWMRVVGMAAAAALLVTIGVAGGRASTLGAPGGLEQSPVITSVQRTVPTAPITAVAQFRSPEDARATLNSAEEVYSGALLWLAAHDSALAPRQVGGSAAAAMNYRQRLEVLDAAMATARRALYEAPDDPVMNRYYLATLGAREVTLRRLTTVLPASQQVLEY